MKSALKTIRVSPTKTRLITREVQGMNAELALATLSFMPNKAAKFIYKAIASAVANGGFEPEEVIVKSCRVDAGPVLKRWMPRAKGRATPIRKPTAHIFVVIEEKAVATATVKKAKAKVTTATKAKVKGK